MHKVGATIIPGFPGVVKNALGGGPTNERRVVIPVGNVPALGEVHVRMFSKCFGKDTEKVDPAIGGESHGEDDVRLVVHIFIITESRLDFNQYWD